MTDHDLQATEISVSRGDLRALSVALQEGLQRMQNLEARLDQVEQVQGITTAAVTVHVPLQVAELQDGLKQVREHMAALPSQGIWLTQDELRVLRAALEGLSVVVASCEQRMTDMERSIRCLAEQVDTLEVKATQSQETQARILPDMTEEIGAALQGLTDRVTTLELHRNWEG